MNNDKLITESAQSIGGQVAACTRAALETGDGIFGTAGAGIF